MSQDQSIKTIKSMPCLELPTILDADSLSSYKSCNTDTLEDTADIDKSTGKTSSVKALIDKHKSFQDKLLNAKVTNFDIKKRTFANACKDLSQTYKDCVNMDGDSERMDNVKHFVKTHVYEVFSPAIRIENPFKQELQLERNDLQTVNFDIKTNMTELDDMVNNMGKCFWEKVVSVVNINHSYYQCLTQIFSHKFERLEDVMVHIDLVLKIGKESELIGPELITSCKEHLEKFGIILDSKLKCHQELTKNTLLSSKTKIDTLKNELVETKRSMKNSENKITILQKEKRDLLNILECYDTENTNKVSLEKRLKAEQDNNKKLREMISSIFKKKIPYLNSNQDFLN